MDRIPTSLDVDPDNTLYVNASIFDSKDPIPLMMNGRPIRGLVVSPGTKKPPSTPNPYDIIKVSKRLRPILPQLRRLVLYCSEVLLGGKLSRDFLLDAPNLEEVEWTGPSCMRVDSYAPGPGQGSITEQHRAAVLEHDLCISLCPRLKRLYMGGDTTYRVQVLLAAIEMGYDHVARVMQPCGACDSLAYVAPSSVYCGRLPAEHWRDRIINSVSKLESVSIIHLLDHCADWGMAMAYARELISRPVIEEGPHGTVDHRNSIYYELSTQACQFDPDMPYLRTPFTREQTITYMCHRFMGDVIGAVLVCCAAMTRHDEYGGDIVNCVGIMNYLRAWLRYLREETRMYGRAFEKCIRYIALGKILFRCDVRWNSCNCLSGLVNPIKDTASYMRSILRIVELLAFEMGETIDDNGLPIITPSDIESCMSGIDNAVPVWEKIVSMDCFAVFDRSVFKTEVCDIDSYIHGLNWNMTVKRARERKATTRALWERVNVLLDRNTYGVNKELEIARPVKADLADRVLRAAALTMLTSYITVLFSPTYNSRVTETARASVPWDAVQRILEADSGVERGGELDAAFRRLMYGAVDPEGELREYLGSLRVRD